MLSPLLTHWRCCCLKVAIWPSLSPCTVLNPILLTYLLLSYTKSSICYSVTIWIKHSYSLSLCPVLNLPDFFFRCWFTGFGEPSEPGPVPALLDWETVHKKLPWNVIIVLGGGFALADACKVSLWGHLRVKKINSYNVVMALCKTAVSPVH